MWIFYALLTALFFATSDALAKRALTTRDEYVVAWIRLVFSLPVLFLSLLFIEFPPLDPVFWAATLSALPLEVTAIILYTRALKVSPMSLTIPFLSLTPVFLIATSYAMLGETVSLRGASGISLIAAGSYTLNLHRVRYSVLEPFRAILKEEGSMLMIIVAFIFSITSSLGKMAIEHSSPIFFGSFYFILVTVVFTPIALSKSSGMPAIHKKDFLPLFPIGFTFAMMIIFHMLALDLTRVAYMVSVKRMSLLFSVMYGYFLFNEKNIGERAIGSLLMLAGFLLIVLGN